MHTKTILAAAGMAICLMLASPSGAGAAGTLPPQPKVGEAPPDTLGRDRDGKDVTVSQYRGKVLIVTFWASWCGPCRRELPVLGKIQQAVGHDYLEVVAVNFKESRRDLRTVIRANKDIDLHYIADPSGAISDRYGVSSLPNMFIIGQDGRVAHVHRGYTAEKTPDFVEEILAMLPPEALSRSAGG